MRFEIRIDAREATKRQEERDAREKDTRRSMCALAGLVAFGIIALCVRIAWEVATQH